MKWENAVTTLFVIVIVGSIIWILEGCATGLSGAKVKIEKDGSTKVEGPDYQGENTKDVSSPKISVKRSQDGNLSIAIGSSKASEFESSLNENWLMWCGVAFLAAACVTLYLKLWGLSAIIGSFGLGMIAFAFNPWLLTLSGIGLVALLGYSVYTGKLSKTLKTSTKES